MSQLQGQAGELSFTVQIIRKATGQVEEHQLVGRITGDQAEALGLQPPHIDQQEDEHGRHP